jgi:anti-sigma regulatory factor (Ser/Thr protein kinase)
VDEPFHAELTLPNVAESLPVARDYLTRLAALAGLDGDDGKAVVAAGTEACANVIDHAYEPGERGTFTVVGDATATGVVVGVRDQGLPLDLARLSRPDASAAKVSAHGGLRLMQEAVDSLEWVHRGRQGKELRLVKRRPADSIHGSLRDDDRPVDDEDAVPLAPEQEYVVRRFEPADAPGVSRCIYRVYGNTYIHDSCYYPDRLVALNHTGELASVVTATLDGEVVGHYALERPGLTRVAERGMAVVAPAHRGRDLMGRMRTFIEDEAHRLGLVGVYSVAVTKHVYSQKVNDAWGSAVCGVFLGGGPATQVFKGLEEDGETPQRVTWVIYYTYVDRPEKVLVHPPPRHRAMIDRIYAGLDIPVEWHDEVAPPVGDGEIEVSFDAVQASAVIIVRQVGEDTDAEIRRATEDLFGITGAQVAYLDLPLADPSTPTLLDACEEAGFCFAGIGPSFLDEGDALLLQKLASPLDFDEIEIANPFGRELLGYIKADRERVDGLAR